MIQYDVGKKSKQGNVIDVCTCPVCGSSELNYGTINLDGNNAYYPWGCDNCKTEGQEWYSLTFLGQNVKL